VHLLIQAIIISCCGCFHGRTLAAISMSCDNEAVGGFGPLLPGLLKVEYGNADALEGLFQSKLTMREHINYFFFDMI
jgi:ornithine--oxo-acid transaminase